MRSTRTQIIAVGAEVVSAAVFHPTKGGRLVLKQLATIPHARSPGECVASLADQLALHGDVRIVVPGTFTLTKIVKTPLIAKTKLSKIADFEASRQIPAAMGEVVWDFAHAGSDGDSMELMLVAAKRERISEWCDACAAARLRVTRISPASTVLLRGFRHAFPGIENVVLINVGSRCTEVILVRAEKRFFRTIAMTQPAAADNDATVFPTKLAMEVARTLLTIKAQTAIEPSRIYLGGDPTLLAAAQTAIESTTDIPLARHDPTSALQLLASETGSEATSHGRHLAELIGAAMNDRHLRGVLEINLLPKAARECDAATRRQRWWLAAASFAVAGVGVTASHFHDRSLRAQRNLQAIQGMVAEARHHAQRNAENLEELVAVQHAIAKWENLADARTGWVRFLADVQDRVAVVDGVWLEKMAVVADAVSNQAGVASPHTELSTKRVLLKGCLLSPRVDETGGGAQEQVRNLLVSLGRSPYVRAIESEHFDAATPGVLRFAMTIVTSADCSL